MSDQKIGSKNDLNDHEMYEMFELFEKIKEKNQDSGPNYLDLSKERTIALTYDNNLIYFNSETKTLGCYGLLGKKLVLEK